MAINLQKHSFALVILLNCIIISIKFFVYFQTGSIAVFSSLSDSILDLIISAINSIVFVYASKPKDDDHKFGHTAIEDLVSFFQIILIFVSSVFMFYKTLTIQNEYQFSWQYLFLMLANALPLFCIILIQMQNHKKTNSTIVNADLLHYSTDFLTLASVIIAMILTHFTQILWFDVACGVLVMLMITKSCFSGVLQAFNNIMAREIDDSEIQLIKQTIFEFSEIKSFKNLRTRKAGRMYFVNVDIILSQQISLYNAHAIAHNLEEKIHQLFPNCDIVVHMEPENA